MVLCSPLGNSQDQAFNQKQNKTSEICLDTLTSQVGSGRILSYSVNPLQQILKCRTFFWFLESKVVIHYNCQFLNAD